MNVFYYFLQNYHEILELTLEHLWLVGISTLLAVLIGIPLGIVSAHWPVWNKPVLGTANIIQTIPSLALFGFLLPVPWLGDRADRLAIVALTLYALLPIIRNTSAGITGVDAAVREAARGMGMTDRQILWKVELPLSIPTVIAGVRIATVLTIGIATIAAAVGAGGLGEFIFRGLAMVNDQLILAGAVPAALLALAADFMLGLLERRLRPAGLTAHWWRYEPGLAANLRSCFAVRLRITPHGHDRRWLEEFFGAGAARRNFGATHRSSHALAGRSPFLPCGLVHLSAGPAFGPHRHVR